MGLLELDRTNGQEYWNMDLNYYCGEMDPKGFSDNMASNCNGNDNQHSPPGTAGDEEAPPSYADAFPPLPTAPSDSDMKTAPFVKWGKRETKNVTKPTPKAVLTNVTQVRQIVILLVFYISFQIVPITSCIS